MSETPLPFIIDSPELWSHFANIFQQTPNRTRMSSITQKFMDIRLQGKLQDIQEIDEVPADNRTADPDYQDEEDTYPPVSNETIVNTYLVTFANAITILLDGVKAHWSAERKAYKVGRRNDGKFIKLYEARTDGHLFTPNDRNTDLILEAKPMMRDDSPRIRMQETAQMAAWIHAERDIYEDNGPNKCRFQRILLSQNIHEIYLIFATYDADYIDYLTNPDRSSKQEPFSRMNEYGPWNIGSRDDIEHIASIIFCMALQFSFDTKTS